jgi:hypothetical protein
MTSPSERFARTLAAIDAANAADPGSEDGKPNALLYGQRMSAALVRFEPDASEPLRVAARAQHIERWIFPRATFPEGRIGYLSWRKALQRRHAERTGGIMREEGYSEEEIARAGQLLRKERLKDDAEVQVLEDVICLVFLKHEAQAFIAKHDDAKVREILVKTARKMSPRGVAEAAKLALGARLARLLKEALAA